MKKQHLYSEHAKDVHLIFLIYLNFLAWGNNSKQPLHSYTTNFLSNSKDICAFSCLEGIARLHSSGAQDHPQACHSPIANKSQYLHHESK